MRRDEGLVELESEGSGEVTGRGIADAEVPEMPRLRGCKNERNNFDQPPPVRNPQSSDFHREDWGCGHDRTASRTSTRLGRLAAGDPRAPEGILPGPRRTGAGPLWPFFYSVTIFRLQEKAQRRIAGSS